MISRFVFSIFSLGLPGQTPKKKLKKIEVGGTCHFFNERNRYITLTPKIDPLSQEQSQATFN